MAELDGDAGLYRSVVFWPLEAERPSVVTAAVFPTVADAIAFAKDLVEEIFGDSEIHLATEVASMRVV